MKFYAVIARCDITNICFFLGLRCRGFLRDINATNRLVSWVVSKLQNMLQSSLIVFRKTARFRKGSPFVHLQQITGHHEGAELSSLKNINDKMIFTCLNRKNEKCAFICEGLQ